MCVREHKNNYISSCGGEYDQKCVKRNRDHESYDIGKGRKIKYNIISNNIGSEGIEVVAIYTCPACIHNK